jgi:hypothetical protein
MEEKFSINRRKKIKPGNIFCLLLKKLSYIRIPWKDSDKSEKATFSVPRKESNRTATTKGNHPCPPGSNREKGGNDSHGYFRLPTGGIVTQQVGSECR